MNDELPNQILCGSTIVKPNVKEFTSDGHGVIFEDVTQIDHVDCILMATGFDTAFPYLNEKIISVKDNKVKRTSKAKNMKYSRCLYVGSTL
jgi:hypothetical protein